MHCFSSENQTCTGTVIFGVESFKVFKSSTKPTAEKSTTENPRTKRPIFVIENILLSFSGRTHAQAKCPPVPSY